MLVHHRINIWSSSTTERKTVSRGSSQGKIELTANAFVFKNLKMEVDTEKDLVKGSAEQTGNELTRGLMKHKFNERYCTRSNNETESSHWLADDYYRKGKNDESNTNQTQVKESKSSRKCSKLCYGNHMELFLKYEVFASIYASMLKFKPIFDKIAYCSIFHM